MEAKAQQSNLSHIETLIKEADAHKGPLKGRNLLGDLKWLVMVVRNLKGQVAEIGQLRVVVQSLQAEVVQLRRALELQKPESPGEARWRWFSDELCPPPANSLEVAHADLDRARTALRISGISHSFQS